MRKSVSIEEENQLVLRIFLKAIHICFDMKVTFQTLSLKSLYNFNKNIPNKQNKKNTRKTFLKNKNDTIFFFVLSYTLLKVLCLEYLCI